MDVAAFIISLLALVLSVIVAIVEARRDAKNTRISIEFEFYKDIYKEYLVSKIPQARGLMWFGANSQLQDAQYLIEELNSMRRDSLYFSYNNKKFFKELKGNLQELEDYIIKAEGKTMDAQDRAEFEDSVQKGIDNIYGTISKGYFGKL